ncbi:sialic acid-binding Ig-like lectin 5 isoform X2 [Cyclopterus lumpus]|uniref:sialic acid-binding Ig-like lectin 5 isoform X2 n=1 Tax=Cyclopterus lumpus TaxID=8103 RepID=UPI00148673EE|nr:sialic acid-binding Ig-like lectin 5 isoform X2 [Cyclopterus lumpus]
MFVLIWATLLFSVRGIDAVTGESVKRLQSCYSEFCITLIEGEITAEAGLCVVIPCFFTTGNGFTPQYVVWYKCEPPKGRCGDADVIFHTNENNNNKVQAEFLGRVSLLEPDVSQKNCSIIINELTESDSGKYQVRVNSVNYWGQERSTFSTRATVSVKGLTQKPSVLIPPLTEGQQTTLTCTAPGLCSGSHPEITWTWREAGEKDSYITGNITAVTQGRSSTLTFNPSAEHHGTNVTCKVNFTSNISTDETATLNVAYVKDFRTTGTTIVKEGETLNLTCSVESFPPSLITWTTSSETNRQNGTERNRQNNTELFMQRESETGTLSISNVTTDNSGKYICRAKHLNITLVKIVDVKVIYVKKPVITGRTTVEEGDALSLTCSVESFPPSHITWTVLGSNKKLYNGPEKDTGSATLVLPNVTTEVSGQYICTAQHLDKTVATYADVTVTWFSKILNNSGCEVQSGVLTCVCISEGFPLPTIEWPLLKNHTEYSVITTVSNHTVNSTATLTVKDHSGTSIECVSSSGNGEARETINIRKNTLEQKGTPLRLVSWLGVVIAFLLGVLLSALLCGLTTKCHRKIRKISRNLDETLEMGTSPEDPLVFLFILLNILGSPVVV